MASQVIMDDGTESTMTMHSRQAHRQATRRLDDEYLPGQRCFRQDRAPYPGSLRTPGERDRPGQRQEASDQNGDAIRPARRARRDRRM